MRVKTSTIKTAAAVMYFLTQQVDRNGWWSTEYVQGRISSADYNGTRTVLLKLAEAGQLQKKHDNGRWVFRTRVSGYSDGRPFDVLEDYLIEDRGAGEKAAHEEYPDVARDAGRLPVCGAFCVTGETYTHRDRIARYTTHAWFDKATKCWVFKADPSGLAEIKGMQEAGADLELRVPGPDMLARYRAAKPGVLPGDIPDHTKDPPGDDIVVTEDDIKAKFGGKKVPVPDMAELVKHEVLNARNEITKAMTSIIEEMQANHEKVVAGLKADVETLKKSDRTVKIVHPDKSVVKMKGVILPAIFDDVLAMARLRMNILICGPAGCGKSTVMKLVAQALKLPFGKIGGSGGLTETHLLGRIKHNVTGGKEEYKPTPFTKAYEKGGVVLIDEIDSADANCLLVLNPALDDSGEVSVPNRDAPLVKHKNFVCGATANTTGRGATRMYVGRNQLDEATLDRFRIATFDMDYDPQIEAAVCPDDDLRTWCQDLRRKIETAGLRRVMSTRFMADAYKTVATGTWDVKKVQEVYLSNWTKDEKNKCGIYT